MYINQTCNFIHIVRIIFMNFYTIITTRVRRTYFSSVIPCYSFLFLGSQFVVVLPVDPIGIISIKPPLLTIFIMIVTNHSRLSNTKFTNLMTTAPCCKIYLGPPTSVSAFKSSNPLFWQQLSSTLSHTSSLR